MISRSVQRARSRAATAAARPHRLFSLTPSHQQPPPPLPPPWATGPSPLRLPEKEQREFEELQRRSTGAFSTPRPNPSSPEAAAAAAAAAASNQQVSSAQGHSELSAQLGDARVQVAGDGKDLHPDIRRGAPPEFEGERNPKTGEIGGPKNDPLRWGSTVDWSYNGRVTDF